MARVKLPSADSLVMYIYIPRVHSLIITTARRENLNVNGRKRFTKGFTATETSYLYKARS